MRQTTPVRIRVFARICSFLLTILAIHAALPTDLLAQGATDAARDVHYLETPLAFEPSANPAQSHVLYSAKGHGYAVNLGKGEVQIQLPGLANDGVTQAITLGWLGADANAEVFPEARQKSVSNYIPSADQKSWRMDVPNWGTVSYRHIYPGIDLSFYGNKQRLEYDFRLKPGSDAGQIRLSIRGIDGAAVDSEGNLVLKVSGQQVKFLKPIAYQVPANGERVAVPTTYVLASRDTRGSELSVSFRVGAYDTSRELVIDPVLSYGLQLAVADYTLGGYAVDAAGNSYVTGQLQTRGFYLNKYDPKGNLLFNTVIASGAVTCYPTGLTVDGSGNIYTVGLAELGLPTTSNAYQATSPSIHPYLSVPYVAVFPSTGAAPTYLSYVGGTNGYDYSTGIAIDGSHDVYITGYESSTNFPTTTGAYLSTYPGASYAAFVAKLAPAKSGAASLVYSTLLGATGLNSYGSAIAVDATGNAYVGVDSYLGYPVTTGAVNYNGTYANTGYQGAFVTKVNPTGTGLLYSAYLGPGQTTGIATDTNLDAYVTGNVYADDFPTTSGAYQTSYPGGFATELNPGGSALVYSTFLSGPSGAYSPASNSVFPQSISVASGCASACAAYIGGYTYATDFPAINAIQAVPAVNENPTAFITELAGNGASAVFSTYLGGITGTVTSPFSTPIFPTPTVQLDATGNIYLAANVTSVDYPVTLPPTGSAAYSYIAKLSPTVGGSIIPYPTKLDFDNYNTSGQAIGVASTTSGVSVPLVLRNLGSAAVTISSLTFTPATEFSETDNCELTIPAGGSCTLNLIFTPTAAGLQTGTLSIASNATTTPVSVPLSGTGQAYGYLQISSASVNFPDQAVNTTSAQQMITVTNVGKSAVTLSPITLNAIRGNWGNGSDFQVLTNCPASIPASASCTIGVTFTPLATGPRGADFYLQGSGFGDQYIYLYGSGIVGTSQGTVALSATILNFNTQLMNTTSSHQAVTFTNTSTAPIFIYGASIATQGQTGSSDFAIASGNCLTTGPVELYPQGYCTLSIDYTPSVATAETGTLTFTDSAAGSPRTVSLTGAGLAAAQTLEFTPGNFVFPDQPLGVPSTAQYFYVYNTGTSPITVDRVLASGDFSIVSSSCPGAILRPNPASGYEPSPNCNVRVAFTPTATGARTGVLSFADTAGATQTLTLAGNGIAATGGILLEPASLTFQAQAIGTTSAVQSVSIVNPGNSPTNITNITTTGDYAITSDCSSGTFPYILGAQRTCNVQLTFTPTSTASPDNGSLVISSSAGTTTMPLTGSGETATIALGLTPTAASFGNIAVGTQSFVYNIYVRNTGTEALTLTSGALSGTNATDYGLGGGSCGFYGNALAPGASCYVQAYLTPAATGSRLATTQQARRPSR